MRNNRADLKAGRATVLTNRMSVLYDDRAIAAPDSERIGSRRTMDAYNARVVSVIQTMSELAAIARYSAAGGVSLGRQEGGTEG
jgi:hypothetical protein